MKLRPYAETTSVVSDTKEIILVMQVVEEDRERELAFSRF
jgi:hypothetical protein